MSVSVQLDLVEPGQDHGEAVAIWSGQMAEAPARGDTIDIRTPGAGHGTPAEFEGTYVVLGRHWTVFAGTDDRAAGSMIVGVRRALPGDSW